LGLGAVSGSVVFLVDFLLGVSALVALFSDFSVLVSDASASPFAASLFFEVASSVVFLVEAFGDFSVVGLVFVEDDSLGELLVECFGAEALAEGFGEAAAALIGVGFGVTMAAAVPLGLGAAEMDGAAVAATLALGAGAVCALVDALVELVTVEPPLEYVRPK
jgi:hypothetical protein